MLMVWLVLIMPVYASLSLAAPSISTVRSEVLSDTTARVNWTTDAPADSMVRYDTDTNLDYSSYAPAQSSALVTQHSVVLGGMHPSAKHYFDVRSRDSEGDSSSDDNSGSLYSFTTYATITITDVSVEDLTTDSARIKWRTNLPQESVVVYGPGPEQLTDQKKESVPVTEHSVQLTGLQKGEKVYFKTRSGYKVSALMDFTVPYDITPPFIDLETPEVSTRQSELTVKGTTESMSEVSFYVNYILRGREQTDETGAFSRTVSLSDGENIINVTSVDPYGNQNSTKFTIIVDLSPPEIRLIDFDENAPYDYININVTLDETAVITIRYNNNVVATGTSTFLNKKITLAQDADNIINITAVDLAGNKAELIKRVLRIPPPEINLIYPDLSRYGRGALATGQTGLEIHTFYEEQRLEGSCTAPGATINVLVYNSTLHKEKAKEYSATVNDEGYWSVIIKLEKTSYSLSERERRYYDGQTQTGSSDVSGSFSMMQPTKNFVDIKAVDRFDRESNEIKLIFGVQQCGSGGDFEVTVEPDKHNFKPYRLLDGTEIMNLNIHLDWNGMGQLGTVSSVKIRKATETLEMRENSNYDCFLNDKGNIFRPNPRFAKSAGQDRTFWYLSYRLAPWQGLDDAKVRSWREAFGSATHAPRQCWMDLIIEIDYTVQGIPGTQKQEHCHLEKRLIDPEIDPNLVIPEFLMEASLAFLESTLEVISKIKKPLEFAVQKARLACWIGSGAMLVQKIRTRMACNTVTSTLQGCSDAIKLEKSIYNKYRLACDRVWCKDVPVNPYGSGTDPSNTKDGCNTQLFDNYPLNGLCRQDSRFACISLAENNAQYLVETLCDTSAQPTNVNYGSHGPTRDCYLRQGVEPSNAQAADYFMCCLKQQNLRQLHEYSTQVVDKITMQKPTDWAQYDSALYKKENSNSRRVKSDKLTTDGEWVAYRGLGGNGKDFAWDYGMYAGYITETMNSDTSQINNFDPARDFDPATVLLGPVAYIAGTRLSSYAKSDLGGRAGSALARLKPLMDRDKSVADNKKIEYETKTDVTPRTNNQVESSNPNGNTEQSESSDDPNQLTLKYVPGLYGTACFNQKSVWLSNECMFQPRQNWFASLQCACITDIHGRVLQFENIAAAMYQCLKTVEETGSGGVGACKEMFAQHVCDLFTWLLVKFAIEKAEGQFYGQTAEPRFLDAMGMGVKDFYDQLTTDYSTNFQVGLGFNIRTLAHGFCMGALFNQMPPIFQTMFEGSAGGPPRQSTVVVYPSKRELMGSDPTTGNAVFEYRLGISFSAGSRIRYMRAWLVCDAEGDCPGSPVRIPFVPLNGELPGGSKRDITQNDFVSIGGYAIVDNQKIRFNKVAIEWDSYDGNRWGSALQYPRGREFDITDVTTMNLFECEITPFTVGGEGNHVYACRIFDDDSYAEFIDPPRDRVLFVKEGEPLRLEVPFSIKTSYGALTDPNLNPFILKYDWLSPGTKSAATHPLTREGILTNQELSSPYFLDDSIFSGKGGSATISAQATTQGSTTHYTCPGSASTDVTKSTGANAFSFTIDFSKKTNEKYALNELKTSSDKQQVLNAIGIKDQTQFDSASWSEKILTLVRSGVTFRYAPNFQANEMCVFSFSHGTETLSVAEVKLKLGIYASGEGGQMTTLVQRPTGPQEYIVTVQVSKGSPATSEDAHKPKVTKISLSPNSESVTLINDAGLRYYAERNKQIMVTAEVAKADASKPDIHSVSFSCGDSPVSLTLQDMKWGGMWRTPSNNGNVYCQVHASVADAAGNVGSFVSSQRPIYFYTLTEADMKKVKKCTNLNGECLQETEALPTQKFIDLNNENGQPTDKTKAECFKASNLINPTSSTTTYCYAKLSS